MKVVIGNDHPKFSKIYANSPYGLYKSKTGGYILHFSSAYFMTWGADQQSPPMLVVWRCDGVSQEYEYLGSFDQLTLKVN